MTIRAAAIALIAVAACACGAQAQTRLSTTSMTCSAAASFVASKGAVVIGTGGDTYERVVIGQGFCNRGEDTKPLFAPTRDNGACFIGYYCFEYSRNKP
jgi:TRAP-type uncharacterized transport system substrate-binding protein